MTKYNLQMRRIGELVGNPPHDSLVAAVQDAIQYSYRLRKLRRKVDHLTAEKRNTNGTSAEIGGGARDTP